MNNLSKHIYDILTSELSELTARRILEDKSKKIGKDTDTLELEDIKQLKAIILGPVLLFGGEAKAQRIRKKLEGLL